MNLGGFWWFAFLEGGDGSDPSAMICPSENALLLELLVNFRLAQICIDFFFLFAVNIY